MASLYDGNGDSIEISHGATAGNGWGDHLTPYNAGVNNAQAADAARTLQNSARALPMDQVILVGMNDARLYLSDTSKQAAFKQFLRACAVWVLTPQKVICRSGVTPSLGFTYSPMTKTGAWINSSVNAFGMNTTALGATATATVSGTTVYIQYIIHSASSAHSTADVYIDGTKVDTLSTYAAITTANGLTNGPAVARYSGLTPGNHTVEIIVTSSGAYFFLDYIAGSDQSAPKVLLCNINYCSSGGYISYGGSPANTDTYNGFISTIQSELVSDGFSVVLVDNNASINPATDLQSDGLHPNDLGYAKIAQNVKEAL